MRRPLRIEKRPVAFEAAAVLLTRAVGLPLEVCPPLSERRAETLFVRELKCKDVRDCRFADFHRPSGSFWVQIFAVLYRKREGRIYLSVQLLCGR